MSVCILFVSLQRPTCPQLLLRSDSRMINNTLHSIAWSKSNGSDQELHSLCYRKFLLWSKNNTLPCAATVTDSYYCACSASSLVLQAILDSECYCCATNERRHRNFDTDIKAWTVGRNLWVSCHRALLLSSIWTVHNAVIFYSWRRKWTDCYEILANFPNRAIAWERGNRKEEAWVGLRWAPKDVTVP